MLDAEFVVSQTSQGLGYEASAGGDKLQDFSPEDHSPGEELQRS